MKELLVEVIRPLAACKDVFGNFSNRIRSALSVSLSLAMLAKSSCERVADSIGISMCS